MELYDYADKMDRMADFLFFKGFQPTAIGSPDGFRAQADEARNQADKLWPQVCWIGPTPRRHNV